MPQMIFVNLPVSDVTRSKAFYQGLGWSLNPQFSDDDTGCIVVSETIYFMIMTREKFAGFVDRPVGEPAKDVQSLVALTFDTRAEIDAFGDRVLAHGGTDNAKVQDFGFMYSRSFSDPDGHILEAFWMDMAAATEAMAAG